MGSRIIYVARIGMPLLEQIWQEIESIDHTDRVASKACGEFIDRILDKMFWFPPCFEVYYISKYCDFWEPELLLRRQIRKFATGKKKNIAIYARTLVWFSPLALRHYENSPNRGVRMFMNRLSEAYNSTTGDSPILICFKTTGPSCDRSPQLDTSHYKLIFDKLREDATVPK